MEWLNQRKRLARFVWLALAAFLTALTLNTRKMALFEWVTLLPMAFVLWDLVRDSQVRRRGLYGYGFFFYQIFNMVNFHFFIALYPLDFVEGMSPMAALAVVVAGCAGLSALQALTGGLVFVLFGSLMRREMLSKHPLLGAGVAGALWAILEWSQTLGWVGVPWGRLAIGQVQLLPLVQTASLFGCCFVTFLIVCVNFLLYHAIFEADKRRLCALSAATLFVANAAAGTALYLTNGQKGETVRMAAVQGNIPSQEKWSGGMGNRIRDAYAEGTEQAAEQGAQIVVWPESALPYSIHEGDREWQYLRELSQSTGVIIFAGVLLPSEDAGDYNSILVAMPDGSMHKTVYSKRHLVPFGEYVPLRSLFEVVYPPLTDLSMLSEDCVAGEEAAIVSLTEADVGSLICFDSIYDELARDSALSGAQVIAISTNDSWFLDSAALYMHNAQAQLRAIENGRAVLRAGNTGLTTVISPRGEILNELEPHQFGVLVADVEKRENTTLYGYLGNAFVYLCILTVSYLWVVSFLCEISKKYIDRRGKI